MIQYKGLRGRLERLRVTDAQVDRQIGQLIEQNPRIIPVTDRPARLDDELVLDYAGYADGVAFEGGTAEKQTLTLGSGMFIPGFEDQLVGTRPGDAVDVKVTFPEQYHAPNLAGKEAVFKCKVHEIRQHEKYVPDDAFAREVFGLDSFDVLRTRMREGLQAYTDQQAEEELGVRLLDQLAEGFDGEITDEQLNAAIDQQLRSLEAQLAQQGLNLDAYCKFTGKTKDQLRTEHTPDAKKALRRQWAVAAVAEAEGIEADEASVAEALKELCRQNGLTMEELATHMTDAAQAAIVRNVITQKVLKCLREYGDIEIVEK